MHRRPPFSDDELDRLLRAVPSPAGLARRLAALAETATTETVNTDEGDEEIGDPLATQLRDVPVPASLQARLRAVAAAEGDAADELEQLIAASRAAAPDPALDGRLRNVPIPAGLAARLRAIGRSPRIAWRKLTIAAALLLAFGGAYGLFAVNRFDWLRVPDTARMPDSSQRLIVDLRGEVEAAGDARFAPPAVGSAFARLQPVAFSLPSMLERERNQLDLRHRGLVPAPKPRLDVFQATAWALGATASYSGGIQGSRTFDELPDVEKHVVRVPRGVEVPLNAEQRKFLLDYGVFPSVTPREFPTSIVPLTHDTTGYELARSSLAAGQWPAAEQMRTEEFLAAVDFGYGRPTEQAARLIAAGAVAPWNPPSPADRPSPPEQIGRLLQLSVQARDLPAAKRPATHLTVGIDVTRSMQAGGRFEMLRGALKALVARLGGGDRLTLVAIGGGNPVLVDEGSRAELEQLLAAVDWLSAGGSGDLSAGALATLAAAARRQPPRNVVTRTVIISDAFNEFDPTGVRTVERYLQTSATRGLRVDLIDVSGETDDTPWDELVRRSDGKAFRAVTAERIRSALMEVLTGRDQTVASDVVLSLTFSPQAVAAYRLLGHEPTVLAGLLPQRVKIDLHAGQSATLLYELRLSGGRDQDVATAVLSWRDPVDGSPQEAVQKITRGMLNPAFDKSSPQLQLATIAAALAGRLRHSPAGDNVAPAEVLQWAHRLERLGAVRGVGPWLELAEQSLKLPPPRRGSGNRTAR